MTSWGASGTHSRELWVAEPADVAVARRVAGSLARQAGFPSLREHQVELVATEMATNLVKYATGGRFLADFGGAGGVSCVELVSLDTGPGVGDPERRLVDGSSTGGTLGGGLGAIARLSDSFDLHSQVPGGTAVVARLAQSPAAETAGSAVGVVARPHPSETVCGDAWAVEEHDGTITVLVADGLGHGPDAAVASALAVEVFRRQPDLPPEEVVAAIHGELRSTRGAAVSVAQVQPDVGVRFCGLGNVLGALVTATGRREMVTLHGTAGHRGKTIRSFDYPWVPGTLVVLHSDGLSARWDLRDHPRLVGHDPLLIAGVLYRDHRRFADDATVVVVVPGRDGS